LVVLYDQFMMHGDVEYIYIFIFEDITLHFQKHTCLASYSNTFLFLKQYIKPFFIQLYLLIIKIIFFVIELTCTAHSTALLWVPYPYTVIHLPHTI